MDPFGIGVVPLFNIGCCFLTNETLWTQLITYPNEHKRLQEMRFIYIIGGRWSPLLKPHSVSVSDAQSHSTSLLRFFFSIPYHLFFLFLISICFSEFITLLTWASKSQIHYVSRTIWLRFRYYVVSFIIWPYPCVCFCFALIQFN